ncbi:MAG TPA: hypothetical protein VHA52_12330 [Candidatus Babeliaceae bacterium]|nr:hypothetical protein [Candidatus Babeliaceae bacterium]
MREGFALLECIFYVSFGSIILLLFVMVTLQMMRQLHDGSRKLEHIIELYRLQERFSRDIAISKASGIVWHERSPMCCKWSLPEGDRYSWEYRDKKLKRVWQNGGHRAEVSILGNMLASCDFSYGDSIIMLSIAKGEEKLMRAIACKREIF